MEERKTGLTEHSSAYKWIHTWRDFQILDGASSSLPRSVLELEEVGKVVVEDQAWVFP
jgi:hypothetical protein